MSHLSLEPLHGLALWEKKILLFRFGCDFNSIDFLMDAEVVYLAIVIFLR